MAFRRLVFASLVAGLLAIGSMASAAAAASEKASCVGQSASALATTAEPGSVGALVSGFAHQGLVDDFSRTFAHASRDACPAPPI